MSNLIPLSSPTKEKKRPSVSSKCLLNIKTIVTSNLSLNSNNNNTKTSSIRSSILPPLPLKESVYHCDETKENKNILNENLSNNEDNQSESIHKSQVNEYKENDFRKSSTPIINSEILNNTELSIIPPLPLNCSMYPFGSSITPSQKKPLLSFPVQSSNRINEEYLAHMKQIIATSNDSDETKTIELEIYHHQSLPIHRFDSESPTISTLDDDEEDDVKIQSPLIFVNSSLNLPKISPDISDKNHSIKPRLSERSEREYYHNRKQINNYQYQPRYSNNYTRMPHVLRTKPLSFQSPPKNNNSLIRREFPQFQSVRTPVQKSSSSIPSEVFDCCQTETKEIKVTQRRSYQRNSQTTIENNSNESEIRSNYFRDLTKIREIMINVSKRLTKDLDSITKLPIVDTHCHFDLIFDRLRIKHNNLTKYFLDYQEYYPTGLSFELAIQVFWRPKQLTENNWLNWYSKYLDDERVYGSCGIHPHWSSEWSETSINDIERCLQHPKIVAIGEIGLDFGPKNSCLIHQQRRAFEGQLKLAAKWLKPIVIHSRDAYQETFELMKKHLNSNHKIHLHCFVGNMDDVNMFTSYFTDIKFGFTPIITRYNFLHTVIQQIDLTKILSETDSPYFLPEELTTYSRCAHPGMVYSVIEMVAQLRHIPVYDIACQLRENARDIYGI